MESKNKPSKDALKNLFKLSNGLSRREASRKYQNLSEKARDEVDTWVNQRFREITGVSRDFKIDPKNPDHKEHINIWLRQRDKVMGWTVDWEKQAGQKNETRYFSPGSKKLEQKGTLSSTERSAKAILRQEFTGKEFLKYIEESNKKPYAEKNEVAYNIIRYAEQRHLVNASRDPDGIKGLFELYKLLISDPDNGSYIQQANRVLGAIGSLSNLDDGLISKPYIIPAEFTLFDSSHITARLTKDNKVWVKLNVNAIQGHPEALTLGTDAFTKGITIDPHEWIRFKLYDEGGVTVYRPALYLLQLSNKSTKETWTNIINVGSIGLPGGLFFRVGGLATKGGRLVATIAKIEKAADIVANGLIVGNIAVRENRGWIIEKYPEKGRQFIEAFDLAATIAIFYGLGKATSTVVMGKALERTVASWDDLKKMNLEPKDLEKMKAIDQSVNHFKQSLKEVKNLDETKNLTRVGADSVKSVDDTAEITKVIRKGAKKEQPKKVARTRETTKKLETIKREKTVKTQTTATSDESLLFPETFTDDQVRNWKSDNFWKTPKEIQGMRGRKGFQVIVDKKTNEVIGAYLDYSEEGLTTGLRADGYSKLFDAKFDLVVRPDITGRGVGGEVLKKIITQARKRGAEHVRFHASNPGSYKWFNNMKPIGTHAEGEGGRLVFKVDDLETRLKPRKLRMTNERVQRPELPTGARLETRLKNLETDPEIQPWRQRRRVSSEEFQNWVKNLPENERNQYMQRLREGPTTDTVGNRRFVLRDAAHEIRVNKDLKAIGIKQAHGDFTGPGSKLEKEVADALSSTKKYKESKMVQEGVAKHNEGRSHHNPKTPDDHLHKALDEYDAVRDPLRDKSTGFGYKDPPMTHQEITKEFIENAKKNPQDRIAMKVILDWKEKRISPETVRREYRRLTDLEKKGEKVEDIVKNRLGDSRTLRKTEKLPKIREKPRKNEPKPETREINKTIIRTHKL
ncbi:GNAT family N-acetyltransferase [Thermoproteota archaeon]